MPISMGEQFRGVPLGDLVGAPLQAACDAQVRLANATATFIQQVGFIPKDLSKPVGGENPLVVRQAEFRFSRPIRNSEPVNNANGEAVIPTELVEISAPLLAMVKIPSLAIDSVEVTFDMEVKHVEVEKKTDDEKKQVNGAGSLGWGPFSLKVNMEGAVSSRKENTRETDQSAKYHVRVHAVDSGIPEGLARVMDIMNSAIAPVKITRNTPAVSDNGAGKPKAASST